jgi:hypothetical protein
MIVSMIDSLGDLIHVQVLVDVDVTLQHTCVTNNRAVHLYKWGLISSCCGRAAMMLALVLRTVEEARSTSTLHFALCPLSSALTCGYPFLTAVMIGSLLASLTSRWWTTARRGRVREKISPACSGVTWLVCSVDGHSRVGRCDTAQL